MQTATLGFHVGASNLNSGPQACVPTVLFLRMHYLCALHCCQLPASQVLLINKSHVCRKKPGVSPAALKIIRRTMGVPLMREQWGVSENHGGFFRRLGSQKLCGHQSHPKPVAFVFLGICRMKLTDYRGSVLESNLF